MIVSVLIIMMAAPSGSAVETDTERPLEVTIDVGNCEMFCDNEEVNLVRIDKDPVLISTPEVTFWVVWCQIGSAAFAQVNPLANQCLVGTERCDLSNLCGLYGVPSQDVHGGIAPESYILPVETAAICSAHVTAAVLGNTVIEDQFVLVSCHTVSVEIAPPGITKPGHELPPVST